MSDKIQKITFFLGFWTLAYIGVIVLSNIMLITLAPITLFGTVVPPAIFASGFVFVFRDFAQREISHYVLLAIAVAAAITYMLAGPAVAIASVTAFVVAELADWVVYTWTKRPFSQRILISSLVSVPVDTLVFYHLLGILDPLSLAVGVGIKLVGALLFWAVLTLTETKELTVNGSELESKRDELLSAGYDKQLVDGAIYLYNNRLSDSNNNTITLRKQSIWNSIQNSIAYSKMGR